MRILVTLLMLLITVTLIACTSDDKGEALEKTKQKDPNVDEISNDSWDLSPTFNHTVEYENGKEGSYTIVGNKQTVGFTGPFPIPAEKKKYFWFYFGKENIYDKPVEIKAIKKGTEEAVVLHEGSFYEAAEVSPDSVNMPSNLHFPSAGLWKVLVYIDGKLYESIVVEVE